MRTWILLTLAVCAALAVEVREVPKKHVIDDKVMLQKQMNIVRLFRYINQPSFFDDFIKIGRSFNPQQKELYTVPTVVEEFFWYYRNNFIQRDDVFSLSNDQQLQQAIALFRMFYYAKDYETFYNLAVWARQNINAYMFVYSFSVAFVHRPDTTGLILPPIYEIFPQFFFGNDVIQQAQMYKQLYYQQGSQGQYPRFSNGQYQWQQNQKRNLQQDYQESSDEEYQTEYPEGQYLQGQYRQGQYKQGQYAEWKYAKGQYPEGQGRYAQGQYAQGQYPEGQEQYTRYFKQFPEYNNNNGYTVFANYSNQNPMSYYLEDIGLNAHYYYFNLYYPFWMDVEEYGIKADKPDLVWYGVNKYLLSRYYLERLSNGLGDIPNLDWEEAIETGYNPQLSYFNGYSFPARPNNVFVNEDVDYFQQFEMMNVTYSYGDLMDWARRIRDAVDLGYVYSTEGVKIPIYNRTGFEIFAGMIRGSASSPNYKFYGSIYNLAKYLLGYSYNGGQYQNEMPIPSVLEQYETTLRDPVYYQMTKWMMQYFQRYSRNLPRYTKKDLLFDGVEIRNVQIDRLITYFDYFYTDLSNAVYYSPQEQPQNFNVRVRQQRLNHKPFTYTLNVNSNSASNAMVKVYIGPKYDQYGQEAQWSQWNWFELDKFPVKLEAGPNTIHRSNREYFYWAGDRSTFRQLYMYAMNALQGQEAFQVDGGETFWGFPSRCVLPKGTPSGQKYQLYFLIFPSNNTSSNLSIFPRPGLFGSFMSNPTGFPFDRYSPRSAYQVPNAYFKDVVITNKNIEDINSTY